MNILGIHDGHNASACLLSDGKIVSALQEERITRVKNASGFPINAIKWVLDDNKISISEIDSVVFSNLHMPYSASSKEEMIRSYKESSHFKGQIIKVMRDTPLMNFYRKKRKEERINDIVKLGITKNKVSFIEHHLCHAAATYYGYGNFVDDILIFTCDGSGDKLSATVSIGKNGKITRMETIDEKESLGNLFAVITFMMGMVPLEHEYKMMGMAPYADERGVNSVYDKLMSFFEFDANNPLKWNRKNGFPHTYYSYNFLRKLLQYERFDGIMGGIQKFCEVILSKWVQNAIIETGINKIALSGGVFMNVKANKVILELPEVKELFIFPSCGDETNPMGACYLKYFNTHGCNNIKPIDNIYWGPKFSNNEIEEAIRKHDFKDKFEYIFHEDIDIQIAKLLSDGEVVARFAGREEFGARSLGNRAILANPSMPGVIKIINEMVKNRDFWMPFACSVLEEYQNDYIVNPKNHFAPYMIQSFDSKEDTVTKIFAGTHPYDKTVRPQVVRKEHNPEYHKLICEFKKITGIGAILNTSFNLHGYPIVSLPQNAFEVLDKSGLKYLAIENYLIKKIL